MLAQWRRCEFCQSESRVWQSGLTKTKSVQPELNPMEVSGIEHIAATGKVMQQINVGLFPCDEVNGCQISLEADDIDKLFALHEATTFWRKARYPRRCGERLSALAGGKDPDIGNTGLNQSAGV